MTEIPPFVARTHCEICGSPLTPHERFAGAVCSRWRCRWKHLNRQLMAHRREAARALGEPCHEDYKPVVVPHRVGRVTPLPETRREAHRAYLRELAAATTADPDASAGEPLHCRGDEIDDIPAGEDGSDGRSEPGVTAAGETATPEPRAGSVCAACEGACCHLGGVHAFMDGNTLERFRADHPGASLDDLIATYAAFLPKRSFEGSCVYHTRTGCALPRELRADMCNRYRCSGLKQAEELAAEEGRVRVYVVVREDNRIQRGAFVDADQIRHYPERDEKADGADETLPNDVRQGTSR